MSTGLALPSPGLLSSVLARANAARLCPELGFHDPMAERLAYRWREQANTISHRLREVRHCCLISAWLDAQTRQFLNQHPDALCINLGAGLDACHARQPAGLASPLADWIDVDLPDVTAIKARLLLPRRGYSLVSADITRSGWTRQLPPVRKRAVLLRAEGLFGQLERAQLLRLLDELTHWSQQACAVWLIYDWQSRLARLGGHGWRATAINELSRARPQWQRHADFDIMATSAFPHPGNWLHKHCLGLPLRGCQTLRYTHPAHAR
ncbi:class I SAM-dependent methyltransferase [Chitinilyticum piscinae]|uniref:Class I SAM-dependent methyltransferase n=1 Tax=Chitinilyticum piscinae TaxID=2866724 RepID=A0A8J7K2S3_9NEIS|nr:class I SAM-dependent methyltransferase [Chitinilyticum piscinae]MBE9610417.1 class I SAM-dependent methyltransferase [Chitinilyticum piscinae]